MKKNLGMLSAVLFAAFGPAASNAADTNWNGISGGALLTWDSSHVKEVSSIKSDGLGYGLNMGAGKTVMSNLYLGLDLSLTTNQVRRSFAASADPKTAAGKRKQGTSIRGTVQVGMPCCSFLPFVEVGYGRMNPRLTGDIAESGVIKVKGKGFVLGGGVKYQVAKNVIASVSYQNSTLKIKNFKPTDSKAKTESHSVRLGVSYLFGI